LSICRPAVSYYLNDRTRLRGAAERLFGLVQSGVLAVDIAATYPLEDAAHAHRAAEAGKHPGSVVLIP
jgi:NADPH2:quinone reductase